MERRSRQLTEGRSSRQGWDSLVSKRPEGCGFNRELSMTVPSSMNTIQRSTYLVRQIWHEIGLFTDFLLCASRSISGVLLGPEASYLPLNHCMWGKKKTKADTDLWIVELRPGNVLLLLWYLHLPYLHTEINRVSLEYVQSILLVRTIKQPKLALPSNEAIGPFDMASYALETSKLSKKNRMQPCVLQHKPSAWINGVLHQRLKYPLNMCVSWLVDRASAHTWCQAL